MLENVSGDVRVWSRNGRPLLRYFPELQAVGDSLPPESALDGEIVIERKGVLDFDALQTRLHPAESRVRKLAAEMPARFVAFDLLLWKGKKENFDSLACEPIYGFQGQGAPEHIVLDGQQRLTALYHAVYDAGPYVYAIRASALAPDASIEQLECPHCGFEVEKAFLRCPSCLRRLKEPCNVCRKPLDPRWKICPYCEAEVGAAAPTARRVERERRPRPARAATASGSRPSAQAPRQEPRQQDDGQRAEAPRRAQRPSSAG